MRENLEQLRKQMGKKKPGMVYDRQPNPQHCSMCDNNIAQVGFPDPIGYIEVGHQFNCPDYKKELHIEKVKSFVKGLVPEEKKVMSKKDFVELYVGKAVDMSNLKVMLKIASKNGYNRAVKKMNENIETNANWDNILN